MTLKSIVPTTSFLFPNPERASNVKSTSQSAEKRKFQEKGKDEPLEKKKITMNFGLQKNNSSTDKDARKPVPVKISLSTQKKTEQLPVKPQTAAIASAFNPDESDEEEDMPFEAKMRMKNIGRETPTAAGPNSFGKGRLGFVDRNKAIEREIQKQLEDLGES